MSLTVREGTIHALIGPNGAGKTTCFNLLTKVMQPDAGRIAYFGRDVTRLWVHYGASKIARGELQKALEFLSFLRVGVLGPLGLQRAGMVPAGVRRVEQSPELAALLKTTVSTLDPGALLVALDNTIAAYRLVRAPTLRVNADGEHVAIEFLDRIRKQIA